VSQLGKTSEYWDGVKEGQKHSMSAPETKAIISELKTEHKGLVNRFDRHLEIYAQNGKELAGLKVSVEDLRKNIKDDIHSLDNKIGAINKLIGKWAIIVVLALFSAVLSLSVYSVKTTIDNRGMVIHQASAQVSE
jgi:hypothetical protein